MRIIAPPYTQTPNDLFDHWLPLLKEVELKVLLVIIRKTFGWHKVEDFISISQLELLTGSSATNVINAVKSLIQKGLVKKELYGKKGKQTTHYELVVHEDKIISNPSQSISSTPDNLGVTKETFKESCSKEQQQAAPAAAVFSAPKKKPKPLIEDVVVYECLKGIDISLKEQMQITKRYDEETVKSAVAWATHPQTTLTKGMAPALKWACQNNPQVPQNKEEVESENRKYAAKYDEMKNKVAKIECCSKHVEIVHGGASAAGVFVRYDDKAFMEKFKEALKVNKFKVLE